MPDRPARPRAWLLFLASWAIFTALAALWSLATPIGASPDEPAHLVKAAAVVRGQILTPENEFGSVVEVPRYVAGAHARTCTAFNDLITADCAKPLDGDPAELVESTTTAGRYNPLYYALVGWPSLVFGTDAGVYAMRIVSGALTSAFLALTVVLLGAWTRRLTPMVAVGAATTPMVFFLAGSVNPNAIEVTATLAAFVAVMAVVLRPDPALLPLRVAVVGVAAVVAANARAISPIWLAIALLSPFILVSRDRLRELVRSRPVIIAAAITAAGVVASLLWLRATSSVSLPPGGDGEPPEIPYQGSSFPFGVGLMVIRFGQHLQEMIGVFGWLDTASPVEVYALWGLLFGSLVVWAVALLRGRALVLALVLIAATPIVPALIQGAFITSGGWIWQGRYALPVLVVALLALGLLLADHDGGLSLRTRRILAGLAAALWAFGQVLAYTTALQRYSVGEGTSWLDMITAPAWQPPGGIIPLLVAFGLVAALAGVLGWRFALPREGELTPRA